jgi:sulfatase modifying factor 1
LTAQYNSNEKRKFKKVKFRLPTEKEWITAAKGGNPAAIYPGEGGELRTSKGLYRCNFKRTVEDSIAVAGKLKANADVIAPVQSYWPNEYGLYNLSGNVAEMLAAKGQTKGGSWQDTAEAMKIDGTGKFARYDNPTPTIGFRYFMNLMEK